MKVLTGCVNEFENGKIFKKLALKSRFSKIFLHYQKC